MYNTHSTQCIYTRYTGYKPTDETVRALWNVLRSLNKEEKALFVQFVTGTSKVYTRSVYNIVYSVQCLVHYAY